MGSRAVAFAVLAAGCVLAGLAAVVVAVLGHRSDERVARRSVAAARPAAERTIAAGGPLVVFREVDRRRPQTYGFLAVAPLRGGRAGRRNLTGPVCSRVAFAAGRGLCLDVEGSQIRATVLDARLRPARSLSLAGVPSRARVSPDGRWGGVTAFLLGHAYQQPGKFSTQATILDLRTGRVVADLEKDVAVTVDARRLDARDRNFWGLTFADDGDTFYATAASGSRTWLIKGSIRARTARAIHANVECPSLSPDGTRIAYKKAVAHDPSVWRFTVLDLASGRETPLAETRSIDDQLAWVDDRRVTYADTSLTTWVVAADGTGRPRRWLASADSATVAGGVAAGVERAGT